MNNQAIGIFDSGVGGLSVLLEIQKLMPHETVLFVADQAYVPYGGKNKAQLLDRVERIMKFFEEKEVKAVVVACNTATVFTIEEMRQRFKFPIIGTVPVVKTIASITKSKKTAVFSTPATAKSEYLQNLIKKFASNIEVECIGGSNLEELVENGEVDSTEARATLRKILEPLVARGVDAIALGCTHYPFLRSEIEKIVGDSVAIVDSGGAVARRLKEILTHENMLADTKKVDVYYTTGESEKFSNVASQLTNKKIESLKINL